MSSVPLLSVIIVSYKSREEIGACLDSLPRTLAGGEVEVLVIENNSHDGIGALLAEKYPWVRFYDSGVNLGFAKANNLGFELSRSEFILFLNPDTILNTAALEHCLNRLRAEPAIGMISPRLVMADGSMDLACRRSIPTIWDGVTRASGLAARYPQTPLFAGYNLTYLPEDGTYPVGSVNGAFMMLRRQVLSRIGLFDEQFFMYGEDFDLCFRCSRAGYQVMYDGTQQIVHLKGTSSSKEYQTMSRALFAGTKRFYLKHFNPGGSRLVNLKYAILFWLWQTVSRIRASLAGHKKARPL